MGISSHLHQQANLCLATHHGAGDRCRRRVDGTTAIAADGSGRPTLAAVEGDASQGSSPGTSGNRCAIGRVNHRAWRDTLHSRSWFRAFSRPAVGKPAAALIDGYGCDRVSPSSNFGIPKCPRKCSRSTVLRLPAIVTSVRLFSVSASTTAPRTFTPSRTIHTSVVPL